MQLLNTNECDESTKKLMKNLMNFTRLRQSQSQLSGVMLVGNEAVKL
jgi:hypothetical protein